MHQRRSVAPGNIVERRKRRKASSDSSMGSSSSRVVLRRNKIKTNTNFEFSISILFFPLIVIFSILWIRMLWIIGSRRSLPLLLSSSLSNVTIPITATTTNIRRQILRIEGGEEEGQQKPQQKNQQPQPKFQLLSNDAPNCHELSSPDEIDLTVVTQLSHDRLWMMEHHCKRYGPYRISIAVYTKRSHQEVITELINMGCRIAFTTTDTTTDTPNATTALLSVLVMNVTKNKNNDYPVNELRNLALGAVRTTHIMYIDVDFWTSKNLYETILGHQPTNANSTNTNSISTTIRQQLYMDPKLALVIPAFQLRRTPNCLDEKIDCRSDHVPLMPFTNSELMKLLLSPKKKGADIFDPTNSGGHGSTDYKHWLSQQQQSRVGNETKPIGTGTLSLHPIDCLKSHRYEPYVVIRYCREITPPFQSIFSGYGKNKMTWMMQIVRSGFVFSQVQDAYLVHYPHSISASRINWNQSPKQLQQQQHNQQNYNIRRPKKSDINLHFDQYKRGQIDQLYVEFKSWLESTIPSSQTRIPMCTTTTTTNNNNNDGNGNGKGAQVQDDDNKLWIDPNRKKWK